MKSWQFWGLIAVALLLASCAAIGDSSAREATILMVPEDLRVCAVTVQEGTTENGTYEDLIDVTCFVGRSMYPNRGDEFRKLEDGELYLVIQTVYPVQASLNGYEPVFVEDLSDEIGPCWNYLYILPAELAYACFDNIGIIAPLIRDAEDGLDFEASPLQTSAPGHKPGVFHWCFY